MVPEEYTAHVIGDEWDGYVENTWTNESRIDDFYSSVKRMSDMMGTTTDTGKDIGMVITNIEVYSGGSRKAYFTCCF